MKKYLALITVLLLVGMMAGCGKKMTAEERFDTVMNKNSKIMSMESEAETKMTMTVDNESMDMAMDMDIKMQRTEDKLEMSTETTNKVLGQEMEMDIYYKDGYYYMTMMGEKLKMPMNIEDMLKQVEGANLPQLAVADMQKFEMKKQDADYQFTYTVKPEAMNKYMEQAMSVVGDTGAAPEDIKILAMSGVITANKDNVLKNQSTYIEMETTMEGKTMNIKVDMDCEYKSIGKPVTIEYPSDLDTYTEIDTQKVA